MFTDKSACTSDAALQRIIAKKAEEAESFADLNKENCTLYAKTIITLRLAVKLQHNEGALLSDLFHQCNDILTGKGCDPITKLSYLLTYLQRELGTCLETTFIKGSRRPGYFCFEQDVISAMFYIVP